MRQTIFIILTILLSACKTNHLAVIKLNGKLGCINKKGNIVILPTWDDILLGDRNEQILVMRNSLYGYLDWNGRVLISPKFKDADLFSEGLAIVGDGEKYGYINLKGDTIIGFQFDENVWGNFSEGLADVGINNQCGYIDKNGKIVIPLIFRICYPFKSGIATVMDSLGEFKLVTKDGTIFEYNDVNIGKRELLPPRYAYPGSFENSSGKGRINDNGDTIVPPIYKTTGNLSDGMYIVENKNGKWGAYNEKGNLIVNVRFDGIKHYNEGLAPFELNGKWGYVDKKGLVVIKPQFDYANQFKNGLAYVELNGKSGFVNKKGIFIIKPVFEPYRHTGFY